MSYMSYGLDPLSIKLMKLRLAMIPRGAEVDLGRLTEHFVKDRSYKMGNHRVYNVEQVAFAMGIDPKVY